MADATSTLPAHELKLVTEFAELVTVHRRHFTQERTFERMAALSLGMIFAFCRHTMTQALRAIGADQNDWTAWYDLMRGERFKQEDLFETMIDETIRHVPADQPYVTVVDGTTIMRSSATMPGSGLMPAKNTVAWRPGLHYAQRFLTCAWLPPIIDGYTRAIPIRMLPSYTPKSAPAEAKKCKDWEAAQTHLVQLRRQLDESQRLDQRIVVLADGAFDKVPLWRQLPHDTILITRTAKNRVLYHLPKKQPERGRRCKYGERARSPSEYVSERSGWRKITIQKRGRTLNLRFKLQGCFLRETMPDHPVYLLVLDGDKWTSGRRKPRTHYRDAAFYLISAVQNDGVWTLPFPIETILSWIWQRWEIEVTHREMKASFGVGDMQCYGPVSATMSVQWMTWLVSLLMLAAYRAWGWFDGPPVRTHWWSGARCWSFTTLWNTLRTSLWTTEQFPPGCSMVQQTRGKFGDRLRFLGFAATSAMRG